MAKELLKGNVAIAEAAIRAGLQAYFGYPITPVVFAAVCAFLIHSSITYAWATRRISIIVLLSVLTAGLVIYWLTDVRSSKKN